jgi:hypothetical protein
VSGRQPWNRTPNRLSWTQRLFCGWSATRPVRRTDYDPTRPEARTFRSGEQVGRALVQHAPFLATDTLRTALSAWCDNDQCGRAAEMTTLGVDLFHGTMHLGATRGSVFGEFLTNVEAIEGSDDYYSYPALAPALIAAGYSTSP